MKTYIALIQKELQPVLEYLDYNINHVSGEPIEQMNKKKQQFQELKYALEHLDSMGGRKKAMKFIMRNAWKYSMNALYQGVGLIFQISDSLKTDSRFRIYQTPDTTENIAYSITDQQNRALLQITSPEQRNQFMESEIGYNTNQWKGRNKIAECAL